MNAAQHSIPAYGLWPLVVINSAKFLAFAMYVRLARREEREALAAFGEAYVRYARQTPAFIPRLQAAERVDR